LATTANTKDVHRGAGETNNSVSIDDRVEEANGLGSVRGTGALDGLATMLLACLALIVAPEISCQYANSKGAIMKTHGSSPYPGAGLATARTANATVVHQQNHRSTF
jgi:hypothetical protein